MVFKAGGVPVVSAVISPDRRALKLSKTSSTVLGASIVPSTYATQQTRRAQPVAVLARDPNGSHRILLRGENREGTAGAA